MKTLLIDDDPSTLTDLTQKLSAHDDIRIVGCALTGKVALKLLRAERPDLVLLDIELPDANGIDLLRTIDEEGLAAHVIVVTAYSNYMLPAFRQQAYDFLTKPITDDDLAAALDRMRQDKLKGAVARPAAEPRNGLLLLYTNTEDFQLVAIEQIGVFQYNHDLRSWEVTTATQQKPFKLKREVSNKDILRFDDRFVQVNQRAIINIDYLLKVKDDQCHFLPPFDTVAGISVGRQYRRKLIERFRSF